MRNCQKDVEKFLVRNFLENAIGLTVRRLLSRLPPKPDIYAVVERNEQKSALEIELTEYQVDSSGDQEGGSPGARLNSFWRKVQASLYRRLSRKPLNVEVLVTLDNPSAVKVRTARAFAEELVRLARGFDFPASGSCNITVFKPRFPLMARYLHTSEACIVKDLHPEFPVLAKYASKLTLTRVSYTGFLWQCTNASAAMVGFSSKRVADDIRRKANNTYKWAKNSEKWLLVCASGDAIVGTAGPPPALDIWQDEALQAACIASPFERVYFWDRPHGWHKCLK